MLEAREPVPPELLKRIREIGATCIAAGCSAQETVEAINIEARRHGLEYRTRPQ